MEGGPVLNDYSRLFTVTHPRAFELNCGFQIPPKGERPEIKEVQNCVLVSFSDALFIGFFIFPEGIVGSSWRDPMPGSVLLTSQESVKGHEYYNLVENKGTLLSLQWGHTGLSTS